MPDAELLESLRWKKFPVLDDGWVALVDVMGSDTAVVDAARKSYGKSSTTPEADRHTLRYMMRKNHGTPFEMASVKLMLRVPNGDTWRQIIRHRAAAIEDESSMWAEPSVNSLSFRYTEAACEFQKTPPDGWRVQSAENKQGSAGTLGPWTDDLCESLECPPIGSGAFVVFSNSYPTPGHYLSDVERTAHAAAARDYKERVAAGVALEQARKDLPNSLYVEAYWLCDLRNVLHFLLLRRDAHAQAEVRAYADTIYDEIVKPLFPVTAEAFEDYKVNALTLTGPDLAALRGVLTPPPPAALAAALTAAFPGKRHRERDELIEKLARLGLVAD